MNISNRISNFCEASERYRLTRAASVIFAGDPTVFGNLTVPSTIDESLIANIKSHKYNGYAHSCGYPGTPITTALYLTSLTCATATRRAIATKYTTTAHPITEHDVIVTSGCSGALEIIFGALLEPGQNILIPGTSLLLFTANWLLIETIQPLDSVFMGLSRSTEMCKSASIASMYGHGLATNGTFDANLRLYSLLEDGK